MLFQNESEIKRFLNKQKLKKIHHQLGWTRTLKGFFKVAEVIPDGNVNSTQSNEECLKW